MEGECREPAALHDGSAGTLADMKGGEEEPCRLFTNNARFECVSCLLFLLFINGDITIYVDALTESCDLCKL